MTSVLALLPYIRDKSPSHTRARHVIQNMAVRMAYTGPVGIDEAIFTEIEPLEKWNNDLLRVPYVGRRTAFVIRAAVNDWLIANRWPVLPVSLTAASPWFEFCL